MAETQQGDILAGLAAGGGAAATSLLGRSGSVTTDKTANSTSTPTYSAAVMPLYSQLISQYLQRSSPAYSNGIFNNYQQQGLQQINQQANQGQQNMDTFNGAHGLYGPGAGYGNVAQELARQAQTTQFNNSLPMLQRQYQDQQLGQAGSFFASLPHGTTANETSNETQKTKIDGQGWAGFFANLAAGAAQGAGKAAAM